jgi:hypothetical protein
MVTPRAEADRTAGTLRLRTYTCLACGHRSASWAAFRAHRRHCKGAPSREGSPAEGTADEGTADGPGADGPGAPPAPGADAPEAQR